MSEQIREGRPGAVLEIWSGITRKLALIFFSMLGFFFVVSRDLIPFLFTNAYSASVPVFRIWLLVLLISTLQPHGVLRVYGETRFLAVQNMMKLGLVVCLIHWFMSEFHLAGAVLVTAISALFGKSLSLARMKRAGKMDVRQLLPWRSLAATAAVTAAACVAAFVLRSGLGSPGLPALITTASTYIIVFALLAWHFGLITAREKKIFTDFAQRWRGGEIKIADERR